MISRRCVLLTCTASDWISKSTYIHKDNIRIVVVRNAPHVIVSIAHYNFFPHFEQANDGPSM